VRLFAGLPLPPETALAIDGWSAEARRRFPRLGWVAAPLLHISLHFFGEVSEERAAILAEDLGGLRERAVAARTGEVGRFPQGRGASPRVIYLALAKGAAEVSALQGLYAQRISRLGYPPEDRPFVPHLTLARVRRPQPGTDGFGGGPGLDFVFDRIVLFQSVLRPQGPQYRPLRTVELEAPR
jgi:2'-5' RNA ligase